MRAPLGPADPSHDVSEVEESRLEVISEGPKRETTEAVLSDRYEFEEWKKTGGGGEERELDNCYQSSGDINSIAQRGSSRLETLTQTLHIMILSFISSNIDRSREPVTFFFGTMEFLQLWSNGIPCRPLHMLRLFWHEDSQDGGYPEVTL